MARRTPIFTALDAALISSGLQPDRHAVLAPLWDTAGNVVFYSGKVRRKVPPSQMFAAGTDPVRGVSQQQGNNGTRWVWAASGGRIVRWYGPAPEQVLTGQSWVRDATSTTSPTYWDFTHYGDWTIVNSGVGQAYLFKDGGTSGTYTQAPVNVVQYFKKLGFILAIGYGPRGNLVGWSDSTDVEVWTPMESNAAGDLPLDDLTTRIVAAAPMGSAIAVYSESQLALVSFIGTPYYFGQKLALEGIGAVGKRAVCSNGSDNYGVSRGGVWWTDGNSYKYIDEGQLHDYLQEQVNWAQGKKVQAVKNDVTGCIEFYFPMRLSVDVSEGWSFDPRTGGWSPLPAAAVKQERRLFGKPVLGTDAGVVMLDSDNPDTSAPLALRTKPLTMQVQSQATPWATTAVDAHTDSRVDEVLLLCRVASNVQFRISCAQYSDQPIWDDSPWFSVTQGTDTYLIPAMPSGVVWRLEFQSTAANWQLDLQGFLLFGAVEGMQRSRP